MSCAGRKRATGEVTRISSMGYTPEEQKKGKAEPRSDFFALGRNFVYLLTAQEPRNLQEDPRSGKLIWRNVATQTSKPLADLIDDLMAYFPKDRPKDTQVLLQRLGKLSDRPPSPSPDRRTPRFALGWKPALMGLGVAGAIAISAFAIQHFSKTQVENLLSYQSSTHQFKIKYPEKWEKQELQNPVINDVVVFIAPKKNTADAYQEQITVSIEDLPKPMSLDEYNQSSLKQIKTNFTDVKILEENPKTIANHRGYTVVFDDKDGQTNTKKMQTWTLMNNKAYVITYTAEKSEYSDYLKTAENMMNSFEIN
ncbi:MAG: DUF1795 domain-containing protein [Oscillatoriales cyanobacterium]|nr:MAG: DUF1795 domain-containing protein [Oscillatoriales cyanobacterium]